MQSHLFRFLLGPIILSVLPDALFHQPLQLPRLGQYLPLLPYASPFHALFINQPRYHEYAEDDVIKSGNYLKPSSHFFNDNRNGQEDQVDARSRNKNGVAIEHPDAKLRINDIKRFLFGGSTTNPFWKTATYTTVSSLNVTSVQNCIPSMSFVFGGSTIPCRRKKRELSSDEDALQFPIDPSKFQRLTVTAVPSVDLLTRNNRQARTTIVSSKDEVIPFEEWQERQDLNKENRFFQKFVASTTAYSYLK